MKKYPEDYYTTKEAYEEYGKRQEAEVATNFKVFEEKLPELLKTHRNKVALMRHGEVVGIYDNRKLASDAGDNLFDDFIYSVQLITDVPFNAREFIPS